MFTSQTGIAADTLSSENSRAGPDGKGKAETASRDKNVSGATDCGLSEEEDSGGFGLGPA
jgi:hypothetical protein